MEKIFGARFITLMCQSSFLLPKNILYLCYEDGLPNGVFERTVCYTQVPFIQRRVTAREGMWLIY
jgi:hypothetical protein